MSRKMTEKKIATEIHRILRALGLHFYCQGDELRCRCPLHKGKNPSSFCIKPRHNQWACWSSHCHEDHEPGLFGMLKALTGKTNQEIEDFVNGLVSVDVLDLPDFEEFDSRENVVRHISKEEIRRRLVVPSGYYLNRGFSAEVLEEFCIGDCFTDKRMRNRAVIPVLDINGNYIGCSGRTHSDKSYINKWIHSKGLVTSATFYGIDKNAEAVKSSKTVILVEGPGDLVKLYEYDIKNVLCPFGTKLTARQAKLLTEMSVETILMGFDNDEAGIKATKKIAAKYSDRFRIVNLDLKCDPDEMTKQEWQILLQGIK